MELKRMRLRNLVNKEFSFYPKKNKNEEYEMINRYDSDEESGENESDYGEGYDLNYQFTKEKEKDNPQEEREDLENEFNDCDQSRFQSQFQETKKISDLVENSSESKNKTFESSAFHLEKNKSSDLLSFSLNEDDSGNFIDEDIIKLLQELNLNQLRDDQVKNLSEKILKKLNLESLDSVVFFANSTQYLFDLVLRNSKEDKSLYEEEDLMISTSEKIFTWYLSFISEHEKTFKTHKIISDYTSTDENPFIKQLFRLKVHLTKISDNILEHLIKSERLNSNTGIINLIINSLSFLDFSSKKNLHNIITNLNRIFERNENNHNANNLQEFKISFQFSTEHKKILFNLSFSLIKNPKFSNFWIHLIDMICNVIKYSSSNEFNDKFIEYMITLFKEFCDYYSIPNEKFYLLNRKILNTYKNYFGIYKCLNGDSITIYTLLFLKFFSIIYMKDSQKDDLDSINKSKFFLRNFESFMFKLLDAKQNNLLLVIFCLLEDVLKTKYNIEFSVNMILLTNMFLCFYNLITAQSEIDVNRKKFFLNCIDFTFDNLLIEFKKMKEMYYCIASKSMSGNEVNSQCQCFSCCYISRNILKDDMYFTCSLCEVKTNLRVQIINPEFDTNIDICAFCNMKKFFESVGGLNVIKEPSDKNLSQDSETKCNNGLNQDDSEVVLKTKKQKYQKKQKNNPILDSHYSHDDLINQNKDISKVLLDNNNLHDKFLTYQTTLYKENSTFIQSNLLNFLIQSNKNEISTFSTNLDISFEIFLNILISDPKINQQIQNSSHLILELNQFYQNQKGRIFNQLPYLSIDKETINYFYFYYFYINFLYVGHIRTLDILINPDYQIFLPWNIRHKNLKILEKFLIFEEDKKFFLNFEFDLLGSLLNDSSFYIREYSLEILFKLYKFKKIKKNFLISTLFENINEASFLIRKRIVKALINLMLQRDEDLDNFKTVNYIFLNKIVDQSESNKIKNIIYEFYGRVLNNNQSSGIFIDMIEIFIEILEENEDPSSHSTNSNIFYENIDNLISTLIEDKKFLIKSKELTAITDYLFENYVLITQTSENKLKFIQALNLIKIISKHHQESLSVYFEFLIEFLRTSDVKKSDTNLIALDESKNENKIKQIICEIFSNILQNESINIKSKLISSLENYLIILILSKPNHLMISALDCYFKILSKNITSYDKIKELACKNYIFLKSNSNNHELICKNNNYKNNKAIDNSSSNNNNRNKKKNSLQQFKTNSLNNSIPIGILSKSLILLSYVAYSTNREQLITIFDFMETFKIFQQQSSLIHLNGLEKVICENIFSIYKQYCLSSTIEKHNDSSYLSQNRIIKFQAFEALGFFFIRFPSKLINSKEIIDSILKDLKDDEEKLIIIRTFNNFFNKIEKNIKEAQSNKDFLANNHDNSDYGSVHLFFQDFLQDISRFVINENNPTIRLQSTYLLKQIIDSGNINLHNVLPYIFAALFDYKNDVRHIAANIIEKIIKNSKEKFLSQIKECLRVSFDFQKRIYVKPGLINTFIKEINSDTPCDRTNSNANSISKYEFISNDENVFELLCYKIGKSLKDDFFSFNKKILQKFIQIFQEIKNFDNYRFVNLEDTLEKFEFYEFICDLIADFKFSNSLEVISIFESMFKDFDTQYLVFKTKLKEYKNSDSNQKIDDKILFQFLICILQIALFKFLAAKFENFDSFENSIFEKKEFQEIIQKIEYSNDKNLQNKKNFPNKKDLYKLSINKELRNFKFFQFYKAFSPYYKKIFSISSKNTKTFKKNDKIKLIKLLNLAKDFYKMKICDFRSVISKFKRKLNKLDEESQAEFLSNLLFNEDKDISEFKSDVKEKENKRNCKKFEDKDINFSLIKTNKRRVSLIEKVKENEDSDEEGNKSFEYKKNEIKNKKNKMNKKKTDRKSSHRNQNDSRN